MWFRGMEGDPIAGLCQEMGLTLMPMPFHSYTLFDQTGEVVPKAVDQIVEAKYINSPPISQNKVNSWGTCIGLDGC